MSIGMLPYKSKRIEILDPSGWINRCIDGAAIRYGGVSASIGEHLDNMLSKRELKTPKGAIRAANDMFHQAGNGLNQSYGKNLFQVKGGNFRYEVSRDTYWLMSKVLNLEHSEENALKIAEEISKLEKLTSALIDMKQIPQNSRREYENLKDFYCKIMETYMKIDPFSHFEDDDED